MQKKNTKPVYPCYARASTGRKERAQIRIIATVGLPSQGIGHYSGGHYIGCTTVPSPAVVFPEHRSMQV